MSEFEVQSNMVPVAKQIRDIISYCNAVPEHKFSRTFESLAAEFGDPPNSVKLFLKALLTTEKSRTNREKAHRMIDSLTSDIIDNISNGKFITPKHDLLDLGLHNPTNLTRQRQPVAMAKKLSWYIACNWNVCETSPGELRVLGVTYSKYTRIN